MTRFLKRLLKALNLYHPVRDRILRRRQLQEFAAWEQSGRPVPPPHIVKQQTLDEYATNYGLTVLVETGTYHGDMVEAMKSRFDRILSIELSPTLFAEATDRFCGQRHIRIIQGDSGTELSRVMRDIDRPTLFWLDGHYSAGVTARGTMDVPIFKELHHILNARQLAHVIVVDDARLFGIDPAYPTVDELERFVKSMRPNLSVTVQDDIIRIVPPQSVRVP